MCRHPKESCKVVLCNHRKISALRVFGRDVESYTYQMPESIACVVEGQTGPEPKRQRRRHCAAHGLGLSKFADSALCWINLLASQASEAHVKYEMQLCPGHPRPGNNTSFMCCMVCNLRRCSASSLPKTKTRTVNCLDFLKKSCLDPTRSFRVMCSRPARLGSFARLGPEGARSRVKSSWLSIL